MKYFNTFTILAIIEIIIIKSKFSKKILATLSKVPKNLISKCQNLWITLNNNFGPLNFSFKIWWKWFFFKQQIVKLKQFNFFWERMLSQGCLWVRVTKSLSCHYLCRILISDFHHTYYTASLKANPRLGVFHTSRGWKLMWICIYVSYLLIRI